MSRFRAVIFDFDGTLAQTMEDNFLAWQRAAKDLEFDIQAEDYYPLEGFRVPDLAEYLLEKYGRPAALAAQLVEKKENYYLQNHRFRFYSGVESLIRDLRSQNIPLGMVTAGLSDRLNRSVPNGFLRQFAAIVTGNDTAIGKPSPEPYKKGAEKLGLNCFECIVVENAPFGIQAAKRAGSYCIALCTTLERHYLKEADEILESFQNLRKSPMMQILLNDARGC